MKMGQCIIHPYVNIVVVQYRNAVGRITMERIEFSQLPLIVQLVIGRYGEQPGIHRLPLRVVAKQPFRSRCCAKNSPHATPTHRQVSGAAGFTTASVLIETGEAVLWINASWKGEVVLGNATFMSRDSQLGPPQYIRDKSRDKPTGNDDPFPRQAGS